MGLTARANRSSLETNKIYIWAPPTPAKDPEDTSKSQLDGWTPLATAHVACIDEVDIAHRTVSTVGWHFGLPPKHPQRPRNVGLNMALLSGAAGCLHNRVVAADAIKSGEDMIGELPDGKAMPAPEIEHASIRAGIR